MHPETSLLDRLTSPTTMMVAELELLSRGVACLPVLASILDDSATNAFGVAYGRLGLPRQCAQEMASRLGAAAKPLEDLLTKDALGGHLAAVRALGMLGSLNADSVAALARNIPGADSDLASESALALLRCGCVDAAMAAANSDRERKMVDAMQKLYLNSSR